MSLTDLCRQYFTVLELVEAQDRKAAIHTYNNATKQVKAMTSLQLIAATSDDIVQLQQAYHAASKAVKQYVPDTPQPQVAQDTQTSTKVKPFATAPAPTPAGPKRSFQARSLDALTKYSQGLKRQRIEPVATQAASSTQVCHVIYTDGACSANGRNGARAGFGVYYEGDALPRVSKRLPGPKQTNVRGEWSAVIEAMETIAAHPAKFGPKIVLRTDYEAIVKSLQADEVRKTAAWYKGWRRRANAVTGEWMTSKGTPIENQDLVKKAVALYERVCALPDKVFVLEWIKGHAGHAGNEIADKLAVAGAAGVVSDDDAMEEGN